MKNIELDDLTEQQKVLLTAWVALADAVPPRKKESLPTEFRAAVGELSQAMRKYPRYPFKEHHRATRYAKHLGAVGGTKRRVKARKNLAGLAT